MDNTVPICRVCLKTSLEYIDFGTAFYNEVEDSAMSTEDTLTYLDCFQICTGLAVVDDISASQNLCVSCGLDLKVAYNFLRKAVRSDQLLQEAIKSNTNTKSILVLPQNDEELVEDEENTIPDLTMLSVDINDENVAGFGQKVSTANNDVSLLEKDILYECFFCEEKFSSHAILNAHTIDMHNKEQPSETIVLETVEELELFESESDIISYSAPIGTTEQEDDCANDFDRMIDYEEIADDDTDVDIEKSITNVAYTFNCDVCSRKFNTRRALIHHLRAHNPKRNIICKVCKDRFDSSKLLNSHVESMHSRILSCDKCDYQCKESKLEEHKRLVHAEEQNLKCTFCSKVFNSLAFLNSHLRYHQRKQTNVKSDACGVCGKQFSTQYYMQQHMEVHREKRESFQCSQCDKIYMTRTALDSHMRMHSGDTQECSECGKSFARSYELKVHMRFHNRHYPFECEVCGKTFAIKGHLRTHMWRHQGLKLQCEECGKLFTSTKALHEHSFTHSTMPYPCSYCEKGYPSKQKYKVHLKSVHLVELDADELKKIAQQSKPKPLQRKKLTLVQADSVMKEVEVKCKDDNLAEEEEQEDTSLVFY